MPAAGLLGSAQSVNSALSFGRAAAARKPAAVVAVESPATAIVRRSGGEPTLYSFGSSSASSPSRLSLLCKAEVASNVAVAELDEDRSATESNPSAVVVQDYQKLGFGMRGIADVIGNARALDYNLDTLGDRELLGSSNGESALDWKADERIKRSCEAGTSLRVAVLVSGGVDSSVALRLLCEAGHSCTAFYLKIWFQEDFENFWSSCPWEEDMNFAQQVCDQAGVELKVVHLTDSYWGKVVSDSISEIRAGRTPNPDMLCNSRIKFGEFLDHIKDEQFDRVASGHYALVKRVTTNNGEQLTQLHLSADEAKDQTYFLSQLSQSQLSRLMFPLGELTKVEVREVAAAIGLSNKQRKDSQGICFLGKVKFSEFIARHLGEKEGCLLEAETGELLGTHKGFWFYTIGQRQGIGLSNGPWFVVLKDVNHNVIFVSRKYFSEKKRRSFWVGSFNWASGSCPSNLVNLRCKVRHGPQFYDCTMDFNATGLMKTSGTEGNQVLSENRSTALVNLAKDDQGLAPGQYAAFYQDGVCLGSGIILEALGEEKTANVSVQALEVAQAYSSAEFLKIQNTSKRKAARVAIAAGGSCEEKRLGRNSRRAGAMKGKNDITSSESTGLPTRKQTKPSDGGVWPLSLLSRFLYWLQTQ